MAALINNCLTVSVVPASNLIMSQDSPDEALRHIESTLHRRLGLSDLDEILLKDLKCPFSAVFRVRSLLGVGAFGVVLEVDNLSTR